MGAGGGGLAATDWSCRQMGAGKLSRGCHMGSGGERATHRSDATPPSPLTRTASCATARHSHGTALC